MVAATGPAGTASGLTVSHFATGSSYHAVTFGPGGGVDTSATVSIAKDSVVREATVRVEGDGDSYGHYPYDVEVFARSTSNASKIYGFSGTGYGAMGHQTRFDTGFTDSVHRYTSPGTATDAVLLPKGATIVAASATLVGGALHQGFTGPDYLNHRVGSNFVQIDTGQRGAPFLADIDGDGDLDLFAAGANFTVGVGYQGGPRFYRNVGNATSYQFVEEMSVMAGVTQGYGLSPALADLDGDGDLDLVVVGGLFSGGSYNVSYYRNTGNASVPQWTRDYSTFAGITTDGIAHAALGDINGDALVDLVVGDSYGGLTLFLNSGNETAPRWTASNLLANIDVGTYSAPALGDINLDGALDLVVGNGSISGPGGSGPAGLAYYEQVVSDSGAVGFVRRGLLNSLNIGSGYTASLVVPALADLDGDGDLDIQVGDVAGQYWTYTARSGVPSDVVLDVGADGTADWTANGNFYGAATVSGLGPAFAASLNATSPLPTDPWGNAMVPVPVSLTTATTGFIQVQQLSILYSYTPVSHDFAALLNRVRQGTPPDGSGNVSMPLPVVAQSAGIVRLGTLSVVLDLAPVAQVPSNVSLPEDTRQDNLLDLTTVFSDDFTAGPNLQFEVVSNTQQGTVDAYITTGHWLGVDALTGTANDNWNGQLNVTVRATDEVNLSTVAVVTVTVTPVNDAPVLSGVASPYSINEDEPWQLVPVATDVDGDLLSWSVSGLPLGATFDAGSGALRWTPRQADVGVHSFTLTVTDGLIEVQAPVQVTVVNVNDPPFLRLIPNQTATEGVLLSVDLKPFFGDEDDPADTLTLSVEAPHGRLSGTVVTFSFEKGSGVGLEKVHVRVVDPHGATAETSFGVLVLPAGPDLALVGVPDVQVVEGDPKTIDVAPYLHNVKSWANLTLSASSAQASLSGTRITFLYPVGYALDTERVRLTAREGNQTSNWTLTVTVVRLGSSLLIAALPDLDVVEGVETVLDLGPYLHNVDPGLALNLSASSPFARVDQLRLILLYPVASGVPYEDVTVTAAQGDEQSADTFTVQVHEVQAQFYLDGLPALNAVEGDPVVLFVAPYVHNAGDLAAVTLTVASAYAEVSGLAVTFLYPVGSGVTGEQVTVVARYGSQTFSTVLSVSVTALGQAFAIAGVPNLVVFAGAPYSISLVPYLHNLHGQAPGLVRLTTDSPYASVEDGPVLVLRYPDSWGSDGELVTLTAVLGEESSGQTIRVTVHHAGTDLAIAPVPTQYVTEDQPTRLDLFPYLLNAQSGSLEVLADSAFVEVSDVTWLTMTFPGGTGATSFLVTAISGGQMAQATVTVVVGEVNDPPVYIGGNLQPAGPAGEVVVWQLDSLFTDEEDPAGLVFSSSDPAVVVDLVARTVTFEYPPSGELHFTLTATDGHDSSLSVDSPEIVATTTTPPAGASHVEAGSGGDLPLVALFLLLGAGASLLQRRDGGRALGAQGTSPTLGRRPR